MRNRYEIESSMGSQGGTDNRNRRRNMREEQTHKEYGRGHWEQTQEHKVEHVRELKSDGEQTRSR